MKFRMIARCREAFPVRMMCKQLQVSPSGYYDWRDREPSKREFSNQRLLTRIKSLHEESDGVMGRRESGTSFDIRDIDARRTELPD